MQGCGCKWQEDPKKRCFDVSRCRGSYSGGDRQLRCEHWELILRCHLLPWVISNVFVFLVVFQRGSRNSPVCLVVQPGGICSRRRRQANRKFEASLDYTLKKKKRLSCNVSYPQGRALDSLDCLIKEQIGFVSLSTGLWMLHLGR